MFLWRNKKDISTFWLKKKQKLPYLELGRLFASLLSEIIVYDAQCMKKALMHP